METKKLTNELLYRHPIFLFLFQLSELEHRVIEAETRADDAEGKVRKKPINYNYDCTYV